MLVVELLNRALVLSGIIARDLEQVTGSEGPDALFWLNLALAEKSIDGVHIPYYGYQSFFTIIGQEVYFLADLITVPDAVTFNIGTVRYSMQRDNRMYYFGSARVDDIESLPVHYYSEKVDGGTNFNLYFIPNAVYEVKVKGKYALANVTTDTELDGIVDKYYQLFLMFELAEYMCLWYKITLPPKTQDKLDSLRYKIADLNQMDLTLTKKSTLTRGPDLSYAQVNLGRGYSPS